MKIGQAVVVVYKVEVVYALDVYARTINIYTCIIVYR